MEYPSIFALQLEYHGRLYGVLATNPDHCTLMFECFFVTVPDTSAHLAAAGLPAPSTQG